MDSLHFPILVGAENNERLVMVHLFHVAGEQPVANPNTDTAAGKQPVENPNTDTAAGGQPVENPNTVNNQYQENRVIFATNRNPLFKVRKDMKLISPDGRVINGVLDNEESSEEKIPKPKNWIDRVNNLFGGGSNNEQNACQVKVSACVVGGRDIETRLESDNTQKCKKCTIYAKSQGQIIDDVLIQFTFECHIDERIFSGTLNIIHCTQVIAYTNIDLGSDATQIRRTYGNTLYEEVKFLDKLIPDNCENLTNNKNYLSQYYSSNDIFYRTGNILFKNHGFFNKDYINYLSINIEGERDSSFDKNDIADAISIVMETKRAQTGQTQQPQAGQTQQSQTGQAQQSQTKPKKLKLFKTYPNIKVVYKGKKTGCLFPYKEMKKDEKGEESPMIHQPTVQDILTTLTAIYKKITEKTIIPEYKGRTIRYQSVLVLVPNIYTQLNVEELLYELNKEMNKNLQARNVYYDFRAMSESDAAFLGNMGVNIVKDKRQDDLYLIIDSGRGTTDFTIISKNDESKYVALSRGGVVGAGGAIDYVFTLIYANHLKIKHQVTDNDFEWHFIEWLSNLDSPIKEKIRLSIEKMKISFEIDSKQCFWEPDLIDQTIIHSVITADDKRCESTANTHTRIFANSTGSSKTLDISDDEIKMITTLCDNIADEVINIIINLKHTDLLNFVDHVLYTGRSFQFMPLYRAFEQKLDGFRLNKNQTDIKEKIKKMRKNYNINGSLKHENLKATQPDGVTKENSIRFKSHAFNINLNSDLCCIPELLLGIDLTEGKNRAFSVDKLFNGVTVNAQTRYYIGYYGDARVFTFDGDELPTARQELVNMTIYPEEELSDSQYQAISKYLRSN